MVTEIATALRRITPPGPAGAGKMRIATAFGLAMTEVVEGWTRFAGVRWLMQVVPRNSHNRSLHWFTPPTMSR